MGEYELGLAHDRHRQSTLTGVPFYASRGWRTGERVEFPLPGGPTYEGISMTKAARDSSERTAPPDARRGPGDEGAGSSRYVGTKVRPS